MTKPKAAATPTQPKAAAGFDAKAALRAALKAANPALTDEAIEQHIAQATGAVAARPADKATLGTPKSLQHPTFPEAPRYRLLEKAFFPNIKVKQDNEWIPMADVLLDPEEQPFLQQLSGPFGGKGNAKRLPIEIQYDGVPDEHMEPLNDAAEWMMDHIDELKAHFASQRTKGRRGRRRDPVDSLSIVGTGATVLREAQESV